MDQFLSALINVYVIGYLACVFSWLFGSESRDLIKSGMVKPATILTKSLMWFRILYIAIKDLDG